MECVLLRVEVQPIGIYRKYLDGAGDFWVFEFTEQVCLGRLIEECPIEVGETQPIFLVNGIQRTKDFVLSDGDRVIVMFMIGGG